VEPGYREVKRRWISSKKPNGTLRPNVAEDITRKVNPCGIVDDDAVEM
jgi:hypothetical protein